MQFGALRLVLQACKDMASEPDGWFMDDAIAGQTHLPLTDVRDCIESLEDEKFVRSARLTDGMKVQITAQGRLFLSQRRPFQDEWHVRSGEDKQSPVQTLRTDQSSSRSRGTENLLHEMWFDLDENLQDAFALAYNKQRREGVGTIRTSDLFEAIVRLKDDSVRGLIELLPEGSLPAPIDETVPEDREPVLGGEPLMSGCVADSLGSYHRARPLPRRLTQADLLVDIAEHGHGQSVARLRRHGIGPEEIEKLVERLGMEVIRRATE
jgi:hypothetical protein